MAPRRSARGRALTWWNTQVQTHGRDAANGLTLKNFKGFLTEEYCRKDEMQKLVSEFWNHQMLGYENHLQNVCPKLNRAPNNNKNNDGNPRASARGRVHMIGAEEAVRNQNVVTGTFLLNGHFLSVLFDSGADRSFVSLEIRPLLEHKSESLEETYTIEYAIGHEYEAREILLIIN
ncbi:reverse transcriptase domain-containing protein [Tanacetum coccineum]